MFEEELFYKLCKKYDVELSDKYDKVMIKTDGEIKELTKEDLKNIFPSFQAYFNYNSVEICIENKIQDFTDDDMAIAC